MWERGIEHEKDRLQTLPEYVEPRWDGHDWKAGFEATVALMRAGRPWIYQGVLVADPLRGKPDLLRRVEGASRLGAFSYVPVDMKHHQAPTKKDRFQLLGYARMLEPVLGKRPARGGIWLNTGTIEDLDLTRDDEEFGDLLADMERIRSGALATEGFRCAECDGCPWLDHCAEHWKKTAHVCLLYGATGETAKRLADAGFGTWKAVAAADPVRLSREGGLKPDKAHAVWLHARAWEEGRPQPRKPPPSPADVPIHFYDIETYGDCVYLHGDIRLHGGEREERQFLAREPSREEEIWREFLDWLARDERAVVYCWANYERGHVRALWERHGGNPAGWRHLEASLTDQCEWVKEHFALPVSSYGIKKVAPVFGFAWDAEDAGGLNSESWYKDWLDTRDEALLAKIVRYNLDDVRAMEAVHNGLLSTGAAALAG
jgi:uncharacterized protein